MSVMSDFYPANLFRLHNPMADRKPHPYDIPSVDFDKMFKDLMLHDHAMTLERKRRDQATKSPITMGDDDLRYQAVEIMGTVPSSEVLRNHAFRQYASASTQLFNERFAESLQGIVTADDRWVQEIASVAISKRDMMRANNFLAMYGPDGLRPFISDTFGDDDEDTMPELIGSDEEPDEPRTPPPAMPEEPVLIPEPNCFVHDLSPRFPHLYAQFKAARKVVWHPEDVKFAQGTLMLPYD